MKISLKLFYQYMAIFFNLSPASSHLHSLQVENCGSNSRLVVDEMTMVNSGSKGLSNTSDRLSSSYRGNGETAYQLVTSTAAHYAAWCCFFATGMIW